MTDAEQVAQIIVDTRKEIAESGLDRGDIKINDGATIDQQQGGCWVQAWVWVANVYIEDED